MTKNIKDIIELKSKIKSYYPIINPNNKMYLRKLKLIHPQDLSITLVLHIEFYEFCRVSSRN